MHTSRLVAALFAALIATPTAADPIGMSASFSISGRLGFYPIGEPRIPDRRFFLWCEGPDILASIATLDNDEVAAWLTNADGVVIGIGDTEVAHATPFATEYSTWSGWSVTMIVDGVAGWLEQITTATDAHVTMPIGSFTLPSHFEAQASYAAFIEACDAERFGYDAELPAPVGAAAEHAVLYEPSRCERCTIYQPTSTFGGTVVWTLEDSADGPVIHGHVLIPERRMDIDVTVSRAIDDTGGGNTYDIVLFATSYLSSPAGFRPYTLDTIALSDNVTHRAGTATTIRADRLRPSEYYVYRSRISEFELLLLPTRDLIEFYDRITPSPLVLELGETGRAVFEQAFAFWHVSATAACSLFEATYVGAAGAVTFLPEETPEMRVTMSDGTIWNAGHTGGQGRGANFYDAGADTYYEYWFDGIRGEIGEAAAGREAPLTLTLDQLGDFIRACP